jgi:hypothetical protein
MEDINELKGGIVPEFLTVFIHEKLDRMAVNNEKDQYSLQIIKVIVPFRVCSYVHDSFGPFKCSPAGWFMPKNII